jgi:hypothetical protein
MESNAWCPRLTAAMMSFGLAVQVKGLGASLVSARKRLMALWRSTIDLNTPRLSQAAIGGACLYGDACSHPIESHSIKPVRIPPGLKRQLCGTLNE